MLQKYLDLRNRKGDNESRKNKETPTLVTRRRSRTEVLRLRTGKNSTNDVSGGPIKKLHLTEVILLASSASRVRRQTLPVFWEADWYISLAILNR